MAHQDDRFPAFVQHNVTEVYRDLDKFKDRVSKLKKGGIVVIRGLPGTGKTEIANSLKGVVFHVTDFFPRDEEGNEQAYTLDNIKIAHLALRRKIKNLLYDTKFNDTIIVSAPHAYLWELKYYKAISCQSRLPFIIYECRTLFSKDSEIRAEQLKEANIGPMIDQIIVWLKKQTDNLPAQKELLKILTTPNGVQVAMKQKPKNNSFCPSVFLNVQYACWLTFQCKHNIFMDVVWHYINEWEEIKDEPSMFKANTPHWGW